MQKGREGQEEGHNNYKDSGWKNGDDSEDSDIQWQGIKREIGDKERRDRGRK